MSRSTPKAIHRVTTVVRAVEPVSEGVLAFELADPDDWELPPFDAGAHIDVHVPGGGVRQYSLFGDPAEQNRYRISVRREEAGRGGSVRLHRELSVGSVIPVSLPRNHFPLRDGPSHVMIAGGVGITPFLSMIPVLERRGASFQLYYGSRSPETTPFLDRLRPLAARGLVHHSFSRGSDVASRLDLAAILAKVPSDAQVYVCGPLTMVQEALALGKHALSGRLHVELFGGEVAGAPSDPDYTVELARSGRLLVVPRGQTMLAALREAGFDLDSSCEGGVCLECKTRYLAGQPVHRDLTLPAADRRNFITPCVSGCSSERLVLDL